MPTRIEELTRREREFCLQYVKLRRNSRAAAIAAGYSENSAYMYSAKLLKRDNVKEYIAELYKELETEVKVTVADILLELKRIAFFDIRKIYDEDGRLKNIQDIDDDTAAGILSIESAEEFGGYGLDRGKVADVRKVKVADKRGALQDMAKMLGYNTPEELKVTVSTMPDLSNLSVEDIRKLLEDK